MRTPASRKAFLATLAALPAAALPARAQGTPTIRVSVAPVDSGAEPYYAAELGLFAKAGLNVQISPQSNGAAGIEGVVAGSLDIATSSVVQMASALLHGVPLQYIAAASIWDSSAPIGGLIVAKDSPIQTARDFEGKTIAVNALHDGTHLVVLAYLIKGGADPAKVSFVEFPFSAVLPAVGAGRVAGALSVTPFMPAPGDGTRVLALGYNAIAERFMMVGFFSSAAWAKANAAAARKFASVIYDTARWANNKSNYGRTAEIIEKYTRTPAAVTQKLVRATFAEKFDSTLIDSWLDWEYRVKFTDRRVRVQELVAAL
jgi:NitT/TauT family transport system substrate-binding protein